MNSRILLRCGVFFLMFMSSLSQGAEINLYRHISTSRELYDGMKLVAGRIICREAHTGFSIWMNVRQEEDRPGHYILPNSSDNRHELRVRLGGEGWSQRVGEETPGVIRFGQKEQAIFDVLSDGNQRATPGEYIFSVSGKCLISED